MRFAGKLAAVSGGASGIGAAIVARLRAEGARVLTLDLKADGADGIPLDVTDEAAVVAAFARVGREHGRLDALVTSAGVGAVAPLAETSAALFDKLHAVNARGTFLCAREAAPIMPRGGAMVLIASVSGVRGNTGRAAYAASKGAVVAMGQALAVDLAEQGLRVNVLAPGPVDTPLVAAMHSAEERARWTERVPLGRYGTPEEIAAAAAFLASGDAAYVTGHVLAADGGFLATGVRPVA
jgi:NAD(P)-dependent dehydrogenase (short-subunit alcohol dehydrogenase family)